MRPVERLFRRETRCGIRARLATLLLMTLTACSVLTLFYQQAPRVITLWASQQAGLNASQVDRLQEGLEASLQWHQREVLPEWIDLARYWASQASRDWEAHGLCESTARVRGQVKRTLDHSLPAWAQMAHSLSNSQLATWAASREEAQQTFRASYIEADASQVLALRLDRAKTQWERLYGDLNESQTAALREHLRQSPWNPLVQARQRRQQEHDLLQLLRQARSKNWPTTQLQTALQTWLDALWSPPDAQQRAEQAAFWQHACHMMADMHRRTNAQQRQHLGRQLKQYADAFQSAID